MLFLKNFRLKIEKSIENFGAQYIAFGIFGILNYPIFYLIWVFYNSKTYESITLRLIATFLCLLLLLKNYWPKKLKPWLPLYWYFTLSFCLPFFFFFMLFKNHASNVWLMSSNTILFWLLLMVDWIGYITIFSFGFILAIVVFIITTPLFTFNIGDWWGIAAQFIASIIVIVFFARQKQQFDEKKLQIIQTLGASIAHELRTPLRSINSTISGIESYLPSLIQTYQTAKSAGLEIPYIPPPHYKALLPAFHNIQAEVNSSFNFIRMLLVNVNPKKISTEKSAICSMVDCIHKALDRYPFDFGEKAMIHWDKSTDFLFEGNEDLIIHVLFNLFKNSLHYIKAAGHGLGKIWVSLENSESKMNRLCFKDTGTGISPTVLPNIFNRFFSKTPHGTGIGLTFCQLVMQQIGGSIVCHSEEGKYTEFVLDFPKVKLKN